MRTTLLIDDALLREAKRRAAESDLTVSEVVNQAMRDAFRERPRAAPRFSMITYGPTKGRVTHTPADFAAAIESDERGALTW
jgi:hypothetical protein